jgi:undecaprenyl phosphate-alpha-L-ara4N flippase subunit ArnE
VTATALIILLIELASLVAGQVVLKHAVERGNELGFRNSRVITLFAAGIGALTISFFLTLALLQHFPLSYFFPFQALSTIIIVLAAAVFLGERLSLQLITGTLLIFVGIVLVSAS